MMRTSRLARLTFLRHAATVAGTLSLLIAPAAVARAQQPEPTGSIGGRVIDNLGAPLVGVQVVVDGTQLGAVTRSTGEYVIMSVPVGTHTIRARLIGYRSQTASVTVAANERVMQNLTLVSDPLSLAGVVVTGTSTPRPNLEASVAITSLPADIIEQAAPRSTTEMLRYVPGFTRVESSGGEVNENITMRGILGVEYVMFMEDGMPVFPTMHTFFMNADNLFRPDENIARMEVVRGGSSSLFGSNTPGAIINFINKTGGDQLSGTMRASVGTRSLARYDMDVGGPLGDDWRFNVGGFYRYDEGVRDPGFPGIRGGQVKANVTRLLPNGYIRVSAKVIDDRNQFILDLPFTNPGNPQYVSGFSDYGSMNTREGLALRVPTPNGQLTLPLGDGLRTRASWFTVDAGFDVAPGWRLQNTAQTMQDAQGWNAIVPSNALTADQFVHGPTSQGGLGLPASTTYRLFYTNVLDAAGNRLPFDASYNGLVAPGGEWHVDKPLSAFQDQLQLKGTLGRSTFSLGGYFANYSQDNHWYFADILTDVRDNPHFLDLVVTNGTQQTNVTKNGFRNYLSNYVNGSGQSTIISGVIGGEIQLTDRLRADLGARVEHNDFVQSSENTSTIDLDGNPATKYDNETFGNGSFRHFARSLNDWSGSLGLNFLVTPTMSLYASAARGYKMPALDEFLNATAEQQVNLFGSREVRSAEGGVKYASGPIGLTVNGFYTLLRNIVSQGAVVDTLTGGTTWIIVTSPENRSYGVELELAAAPLRGLQLLGTGTFLKAELGSGAGADIGSRINGVPTSIGNASATYSFGGARITGDWHWVAQRFVDVTVGTTLPSYNYFNFGAAYALPKQGATLTVDVLNAFQSLGLEEGNPRLVVGSGSNLFLARPLLPRRITASLRYDF